MTSMRMWYLEQLFDQGVILHGIVKCHPYLSDGNQIHTTSICHISELDDRIIVKTQNTEYHLMYVSCDKVKLNKHKKAITDPMIVNAIDRILPKIDNAILKRKQVIDSLKKMMDNNTVLFYIDERDTNIFLKHFGKSIERLELVDMNYTDSHRNIDPLTGKKIKIKQIPKSFSVLTKDYLSVVMQYNISCNRIIFGTSVNGLFDDKIIPEGTLLGYIKNNTNNQLEITFSWGDRISLESREAIKVYYKKKTEKLTSR